MTGYNVERLRLTRLNSCKIARESQDYNHVILLAIFVFCMRSKGGDWI